MHEAAPQPEAVEIPDKLYFRIGEVSTMLGVEPHVLRFWETEFPFAFAEEVRDGAPALPAQGRGAAAPESSTCFTRSGTPSRARGRCSRREPKPQRKAPARQQDLFSEDPLPEIRRELASILEILK